MRKFERATGVIFILISVYSVIYSFTSLGLGTLNRPGPGFMPFWSAFFMLIVSIIWFVPLLKPDLDNKPFCEKGVWVKPVLALIVTLIYAATMEVLGYASSTLLFLLLWQFLVERVNWKRGILVSVLSTVGMYLLFGILLKISLPEGILI